MAVWATDVRKTVTVLFADLTGSTDLGERLDPEALRRVTFRFFDEMRAVLEHHGGTVEKFAGDDIMAVFGVPTLHEDDALRAVRAAEAMQRALEELNEELERGWGVRLEIRIGINSGEVVTGKAAGEKTLATGDAVNLAKRIQEAAAPGEVLLGRETHRLVRDHVHAGPLETLTVKERQFSPWRFLGTSAAPPERVETPLVGRDRELAQLQQQYDAAVAERRCRLVTVLGSAGVGKSRLAREVGRQLLGASVAMGRCLPYGEGITFWPIRDLVRQTAQIGAESTPATPLERIDAVAAAEEDPAAVSRPIAAAIGLGDETASTEEIFWALRQYFEALARRRPLVLVVEDIHWAEQTLLDFLHYLAGWSRDAPILLLCLARPDLVEQQPSWSVATDTIILEALDQADTTALVAAALGEQPSEQVVARIWAAAEGNPLFAEELLRMLAESDDDDVAVPPTINALLGARLDRLEPDERTIVQAAAVIGRVFGWSAVTDLAPEDLRPAAGSCLQGLVRKQIILPDESRPHGEDAFRFAHILMRDAAYQALSKRTRAELHEQHAEWLEQRSGARVVEYQEIMGYHLEQSFRARAELGPVDDEVRAVGVRSGEALADAGRRALSRGDSPAGAGLLKRARFLIDATGGNPAPVLVDLGIALRELGRLGEADDALGEAIEAARRADDPRCETRAKIERSFTGMHMEEWTVDELAQLAEAAATLAPDDDAVLAKSHMLTGTADYNRCRMVAAEEAFEQTLTYAHRTGDRQQARFALVYLTRIALVGPRPVPEALAYLDELLGRAPGDLMIEAAVATVRAPLEAMRGEFERARGLYRDAQERFAELGRTVALAAARTDAAAAERLAGDLAAAEQQLRIGVEASSAVGARSNTSTLAALLAETLVDQGKLEEAEQYLATAERSTASEDVFSQVAGRIARAKMQLRRGQAEEAAALATSAVAVAAATDAPLLHADAVAALGEALLAAGEPRAEDVLEEAERLYELKGNVVAVRLLRGRVDAYGSDNPNRSAIAESSSGARTGGT
jgi:class 3 adenylate cyclase/tetratricopeptide (TPR) repeat protein